MALDPIRALEHVRVELHGAEYASVTVDRIGQIAVVASLCKQAGWSLYDRQLGELVSVDD
jgi:hypothetical protein